MLLTYNQGSTLLGEGDTPNAIVTYNFWREHRRVVVDTNRPRHFRLDAKNQKQCWLEIYVKMVFFLTSGPWKK